MIRGGVAAGRGLVLMGLLLPLLGALGCEPVEEPVKLAEPRSDAHLFANVRPPAGTVQAYPRVPMKTLNREVFSENLAGNGSFEEGSDQEAWEWAIQGKHTPPVRSDVFCAEGRYALRVACEGAGALEIVQEKPVDLEGESSCLLRGYIFCRDFEGAARIEVRDAERGAPVFSAQTSGVTGSPEAWSLEEVEFDVPLYTKSLRIVLSCAGADGEMKGGTVWFDDIGLYRRKAPRHTNLLRNGGFGEGNTGWAYWFTYQSTLDQADVGMDSGENALEGKASLRIEALGKMGLMFRQRVDDLAPGADYVFEAYMKAKDLPGEAQLEVYDIESPPNCLFTSSQTISGTSDWAKVELPFTMPEGLTSVQCYLHRPPAEEAPEQKGTVWFEGCSLYRVSEGD